MRSDNIAGVYGRQVPFSYSNELDKRDLSITFGLDPRLQRRDPFFHNANSIIRHEALYPGLFDEELTNIEDRAWASLVQSCGKSVYYSARSEVYHYHGIHHANSKHRSNTTALSLEKIHATKSISEQPNLPDIAIVLSQRCVDIPPREISYFQLKSYLLCISSLAKKLDRLHTYLMCPPEYIDILDQIKQEYPTSNAEFSYLTRPKHLDSAWASIIDVLHYAESKIRASHNTVCYADLSYVFRDPNDLLKILTTITIDTNAHIFTEEHLHSVPNTDAAPVHDILTMSFRPRKLNLTNNHNYLRNSAKTLHSGYFTTFSRQRINDLSLTDTSIHVHETSSSLALARMRSQDDYSLLTRNSCG